jgi:hypothetical protein
MADEVAHLSLLAANFTLLTHDILHKSPSGRKFSSDTEHSAP